MTYREGAEKYYDLFGAKDDAPFYIELARSGVETWGIDNSPHMLRAAEANLAREPIEVRSRTHLEFADVRDFDLEESFGLVYFPSSSFDHLLEREDQIRALENIRRHIAPGGVYAFDLAHVPDLKEDSGWFVQRRPLDEHGMVVRTGYHRLDSEKRVVTLDLWYDLYEDGRMLERYHEGGELYVHTPDGISQLLDDAGYEIEAWYGDHLKGAFTMKSEMMVIVARPLI